MPSKYNIHHSVNKKSRGNFVKSLTLVDKIFQINLLFRSQTQFGLKKLGEKKSELQRKLSL